MAAMLSVAVLAAACGSATSKSAASSTDTPASSGATSASGAPRRGNRTPPPAVQTSIAEGTPASTFRGGGAAQTAIAEGTPASSLGRGGGFGGGRVLNALATILSIDANQLRTELQADGATLATVAAAHGQGRDALKQALIDATKQRLDAAVTSGALTQQMEDQQVTQFTANIDTLVDSNGLGGGGGPGGPGGGGGPGGPADATPAP